MPDKFIVSGIGCCLVDILYNDIDFGSETIRPFMSRSRGDGGLTPGQLVFNEEFTLYAKSWQLTLAYLNIRMQPICTKF